MKLDELRNLMMGHRISPEGPLLNAPLDEEHRAELSAAFLRSAETGNRPWASIGIDDWLQAGKWWLLKFRSQMNRRVQGTEPVVHVYINLLKACWILTDIVSIHPQRTHLGASNDRRNDDIRYLSQITKTSLESYPVLNFQFHDVEDNTINIWPQAPPSSTIVPRRQFSTDSDSISLQISHAEILFQCFAGIYSTVEDTADAKKTPEECLLLLQVPRQGIYLNAILRNFVGHDICKLEHYDALKAILWRFQLFSTPLKPTFLTMSMIHSVSVLANWPSRDWKCLLLPEYDINCSVPPDPLALLLRTIVNDVVKKSYEHKSPRSELFTRDCLDAESFLLDRFVWKVMCWHCEKFADMKLLLESFNIQKYLHNALIQTAFLRLDCGFLSQLTHYIKHRDEWHPDDVLTMVKAALSSNDTGYLLSILEHVSTEILYRHQTAIFQLAYSSRLLGHIDAMIQVVVPRPADVAAALAWYLSSRDEQSFGDFLHMVEGRGGYFKCKAAEELDLSDFHPAFVAGCCRLIETQRPTTLSLYLDSLEKLGIDFHHSKGCNNVPSSQLSALPALLSPDSSFLRVLLERKVVVANVPPFVMEYKEQLPRPRRFATEADFENLLWGIQIELMPPFVNKYDSSRYRHSFTETVLKELVQCLPSPMPHWPLYCAVKLVCDVGFLKLLCLYGSSLQQEGSGTEDKENNVQAMVEHLSRLSSLEDARWEHLDTLLHCHILIEVGIQGAQYSFHSGTFNTILDTSEYQETWRWMERLLLRDSFFHEVRASTWNPGPKRLSELISMYTKFPDLCPKHLRTQSDWDKWRGDALQILSEVI